MRPPQTPSFETRPATAPQDEAEFQNSLPGLRQRPAARLLVLDPQQRLLLFRFVNKRGELAGKSYWVTPGGGIEPGETPAQAAIRELREETGLVVDDVGAPVGSRAFKLQLPSGEFVAATETYFLVRTGEVELSRAGWTALEVEIMLEHKWWTRDELRASTETIFPVTLTVMLDDAIR